MSQDLEKYLELSLNVSQTPIERIFINRKIKNWFYEGSMILNCQMNNLK